MRGFHGILGFIVLAASMVLAGSGVAYAQTGDCYAPLPGCLDESFGVNGKVSEPSGMEVNGVTIQLVGGEARIVAVGEIGGFGGAIGAWAIARYLQDGALETSFGGDRNGTAYAAVVQPDGMLVVVGDEPAEVLYKKRTFVRSQLTVLRYDQNGSLDPSFGNGGKVRVSDPDFPASPTVGRAVALQSDGKIVVLGSYNAWPAVVRLLPNGQLDTGFSGDGQYVYEPSQSNGFGLGIQTIGAEERIVVAGEDKINRNFSVFRLTPQGVLDPSFGSGGVVTTDVQDDSFWEWYEGLAVDAEQRILAVGNTMTTETYQKAGTVVARYLQSGALDTSFGSGGVVSVSPLLARGSAHAIATQSDGRIVVGGEVSAYDDEDYMSAWRFNADGSPDLSFGNGGWVGTALPGYQDEYANAVALQPDGKIVLAGDVTQPGLDHYPFLARYIGSLTATAHDIAVYGIAASPGVAIQGDVVTVEVTVGNNGTSWETGDVTLTEAPDGASLGTQSVSLGAGESSTSTFYWYTNASSPGLHTLQATATLTSATDEQPANDSRSTTVSIAAPGVSFVLDAYGYKVKAHRRVDLSWTGASTPSVDIYRDGALIIRTPDTGSYTDSGIPSRGTASYSYQVCDAGSERCSNSVIVTF
jgi:uncharacterized delta-60 repeat protein